MLNSPMHTMYARDKARKGFVLKEDCYTLKEESSKIIFFTTTPTHGRRCVGA